MRVVLLTTDTPHHRYYAEALAKVANVVGIVIETGSVRPNFETAHPLESDRDQYEREVLLGGRTAPFEPLATVARVENINGADAIAAMRACAPELAVVYGTRRCGATVVSVAATACVTFHGGDPERYRGLDSHLWALYHRDFDSLVTTLLTTSLALDAGEIVSQAPLALDRQTALHQLRAASAKVCVDLTGRLFDAIRQTGRVIGRPQRSPGRYYSFMPAVLKDTCARHLAERVKSVA